MKTPTNDLATRAKAYAAYQAAYAADPAQSLYLDQVRRDCELAHRRLAAEKAAVTK